jgi:transposase InsO family protein
VNAEVGIRIHHVIGVLSAGETPTPLQVVAATRTLWKQQPLGGSTAASARMRCSTAVSVYFQRFSPDPHRWSLVGVEERLDGAVADLVWKDRQDRYVIDELKSGNPARPESGTDLADQLERLAAGGRSAYGHRFVGVRHVPLAAPAYAATYDLLNGATDHHPHRNRNGDSMSDFGVWSVTEEFNELVKAMDSVTKCERDVIVKQVTDVVAEHGSMTRNHALRLAEVSGWSARQLWRFAAAAREAVDSPETPDGTFLDRIEKHGAAGFQFDELALTMIYLCGGNRRRFRQEVIAAGYKMPSEPTLCRMWNRLPLAVRDGVTNGHRNRYRNLLYVRRAHAEAANLMWELDDFDLDLRVLVETEAATGEEVLAGQVGGQWIGRRPHLALLVDDHSRFITGWMLLDHTPTAVDVKAMFADALQVRPADEGVGLIGGHCSQVVCDNASSFTAFVTEDMFANLAIDMRPAPAYAPHTKGMVERTGQTIQSMLVTGLAGIVTKAERINKTGLFEISAEFWLEYEQLEALCAAVIHEYNYRRPHSAIGNKTPAELHTASNVHPRVIPDEDLAEAYLPVRFGGGIRIVQPTGVQALGQHWFALALEEHIGKSVIVKRLHHRLDQIAVFSMNDEFITMAIPSTDVDLSMAIDISERRKEMSWAINRYAARTREAMIRRNNQINDGEDPSMLEAAKFAVEEREKRSLGYFDPIPDPMTGEHDPVTPPAPKPAKSVSGKSPGGTQPAGRTSPKQNNSDTLAAERRQWAVPSCLTPSKPERAPVCPHLSPTNRRNKAGRLGKRLPASRRQRQSSTSSGDKR